VAAIDETLQLIFMHLCRELRKWADTTDKEHAELHARREALAGRLASALRALQKVRFRTRHNSSLIDKKQLHAAGHLLGMCVSRTVAICHRHSGPQSSRLHHMLSCTSVRFSLMPLE
jgi:hypothetical protein